MSYRINGHLRETMKEAGYKYISYDWQTRLYCLLNLCSGIKEYFRANKHHAGWGIVYKSTVLEFVSSEPTPAIREVLQNG